MSIARFVVLMSDLTKSWHPMMLINFYREEKCYTALRMTVKVDLASSTQIKTVRYKLLRVRHSTCAQSQMAPPFEMVTNALATATNQTHGTTSLPQAQKGWMNEWLPDEMTELGSTQQRWSEWATTWPNCAPRNCSNGFLCFSTQWPPLNLILWFWRRE